MRLDDQGFRKRFAGTAVKRTGRDRFVRNALIAAGNSGDARLKAAVTARLTDRSALVRAMAVWALRELATAEEVAQAGAAEPGNLTRPSAARGGRSRRRTTPADHTASSPRASLLRQLCGVSTDPRDRRRRASRDRPGECHRIQDRVEIAGRGKPVISPLHQAQRDVIAADRPVDLERVPPGDIGVLLTRQNANRAMTVNALLEQEMAAAVLDQLAGNDSGRRRTATELPPCRSP